MNTPVIYKISSLISDKIYVGSAVNFTYRKRRHISDLKLGRHNPKLQCFVNKHGVECLIFSILEEVSNKENLIEREQYYIDTLKPWFNIHLIANSPLGIKRSDEIKKKLSIAQTGAKRNFSPEAIEGIKKRNSLRIWSEEARAKISAASKGRPKSIAFIEAVKKANTGKPRTEAQLIAIRKSNSTRVVSQKTKDAVALQNKNRVHSDETRRKLSEAGKKRYLKTT